MQLFEMNNVFFPTVTSVNGKLSSIEISVRPRSSPEFLSFSSPNTELRTQSS